MRLVDECTINSIASVLNLLSGGAIFPIYAHPKDTGEQRPIPNFERIVLAGVIK